MNKLIYAKEGAKDMLDRSCEHLPWHMTLEVDGETVEIPEVIIFFSIPYFNLLNSQTNYLSIGPS